LKISRNGGVAICDGCRQPWLDRRSHMNGVRSEQVDRVQTDPDSRVLGSRFVEGERRSWRLVHTSDTEGTEFRCGHCGFNMGDNGDEFVRHILEFCPRFSCSWDSDFKIVKDPAENKHKAWTMKEFRVLWQCFEISKLKAEAGWKDRMEAAWRGADMRDVSLKSLMTKLRDIKFGKLCLLERESIGRRVRSKYLCEEVIKECEEEAEEDEGSAQDNFDDDLSVSDKDDLDSVDFTFDD